MKPISEKKLEKDFQSVICRARKEVRKAMKFRKITDNDLLVLLKNSSPCEELEVLSNLATALNCKLVIEIIPLESL